MLAVVFLIVMATANPAFGKLHDMFNSVIGISSLVLAWKLSAEYHARSPWLGRILLSKY